MNKIFFIIMLLFSLVGCEQYNAGKRTCRRECPKVQTDNVGARFMWQDADMTFGECICFSKDGERKIIYVKVQ